MKTLIFFFLFTIILVGCKDITITTEYIKNDYWDDKYNNRIYIERLIPTSDSLYYYAKEYGWVEKNEFYKVDSAFMYGYGGLGDGRLKLKGKVYFGKPNEWDWGHKKRIGQESSRVKTIGNLENDTWYKFSDLKMNGAFYIYVYVDKEGKVHQYEINLANY